MWFFIWVSFNMVLIAYATPQEKWFDQYLDHFNMWENRTFKQRYFENDSFYRSGGPLLLIVGSETTIDPNSLKWNPSYTLAKRLHGKVVLLEHRFYGKSLPFENYTNEDLQYLSVEQALEDLAYFVESYKKQTPGLQNSKVAAFGCSYGASLATWFRYKFPHLVDAAWASSAPLRVALDFHEYYEVAGEMYSNVSTECIAIIRQGYREAKKLVSEPKGLAIVKKVFECHQVNTNEVLEKSLAPWADPPIATYDLITPEVIHEQEEEQSETIATSSTIAEASKMKMTALTEPISGWDCGNITVMNATEILSTIRLVVSDQYTAPNHSKVSCKFLESKNSSTNSFQQLAAYVKSRASDVCFEEDANDGASHCADDNENEYTQELPAIAKAKKIGVEIMEKWLK